MIDRLVERSIEVIREGQAPSGAYVAGPTFPPYRFCWLRDGSFIADAMSRSGRPESAEAFFDWCSAVILPRRDRPYLPARYTLDGDDDTGEWPQLQHDGYGLWLWALREHAERHGADVAPWETAVEVTVEYLTRVWREPCTDWWEERVGIHAATLACIDAGLHSWGEGGMVDRSLADERLDASLLVLPFFWGDQESTSLWPVGERLVSPGGGVHRHLDDTYYGGGEWLLLTAMFGLGLVELGAIHEARGTLDWILAHSTVDGELPEQSQDHLLAPDHYATWVEKWGPPASPLLWSHAMFLTLANRLEALEP